MNKGRLEAFSDGVLAIIITIMVLELKAPEEVTFGALIPKLPVFISYVVSFTYVGIYWNNHHHLLQITEKVNGKILWANLHLLFWLSLVPFATSWIGENHVESIPVAFYGFILMMSGIAFYLLSKVIIKTHGEDFALKQIIKGDRKEVYSILIYLIGIIFSFISPWIGIISYIIPALMWLMPDKKIEKILDES